MARPTRIVINTQALLHNVSRIKSFAPHKKMIAMVKANAYGCGVHHIVPVLEDQVDALGVASLEEALQVKALGSHKPCIIFQGVYQAEEFLILSREGFACVLHTQQQLNWLLNQPLPLALVTWLKVNTGMNRLGFPPDEVPEVYERLSTCPWVKEINLITHLACADEPNRKENTAQIDLFQQFASLPFTKRSMANSAATYSLANTHADIVRAGIMMYGASPYPNQTSADLGLIPVVRFFSAIIAVHDVSPGASIGYGATWQAQRPSRIGIVTVGYGDGYPRHIQPKTQVWIQGHEIPIVGRVSMDMLAIDITEHPQIQLGAEVELWGKNMLIERIAQSAGTIAYELLCQMTQRPTREVVRESISLES